MNSLSLFSVKLLRQTLLLMGLLGYSCLALAEGEQIIETQPQVQVKAWIEPEQALVVSQQLILYIEVSTADWFAGGTRIETFEIDDVVVLRREKFSVNSTRRVAEQTWSVQLWSISLYPQSAGQFLIPAITLTVPTAGEGRATTKVQLQTEPISFAATLPADIGTQFVDQGKPSKTWVATNSYAVTERFDRPLSGLAVGDSITRTIQIQSENVAAMMLPALQLTSPAGLAAYQQPAKMSDQVNRGDYLASRYESVSYVIEKAGAYRLPQLDFYWWDLDLQQMRHEVLPAQIISTTGAASPIEVEDTAIAGTSSPDIDVSLAIFLALLALLICFCIGFIYFKRTRVPGPKKAKSADLNRLYQHSCRQGDYHKAVGILYLWLEEQGEKLRISHTDNSLRRYLKKQQAQQVLRQFDALMEVAHAERAENSSELQSAQSLIDEISLLFNASATGKQPPTATGFSLN